MIMLKSVIGKIVSKRNVFTAVLADNGEVLDNAGSPFLIRHPRDKKLTHSDLYAEVMVDVESGV